MVNSGFIHPLALVENSTIGQGTRIWQFASVIRGTVLGEDCNVAHGACLDGPRIGDRCIIGHHVAIGPGFLIGSDVFIGPGVIFCNDMWPSTKKGDDWSMEPFLNGEITIAIEDGVAIGANATILPGVRIGKGAMIAAGAVVNRLVPPGTLFTRAGEIKLFPEKRTRMKLLPKGQADDHVRHLAVERQ